MTFRSLLACYFSALSAAVCTDIEQSLMGHLENLNAYLASQTRSSYCKELLQIYQEWMKAKTNNSLLTAGMCISSMMHYTSMHSFYKGFQ